MTTLIYGGLCLYVITTCLYVYRLFSAGAQLDIWGNRILMVSLMAWLVIFGGLGVYDDWTVNATQRWLWSSAWGLSLAFFILRRRFNIDGAGSTIVGLSTVLTCLGIVSKHAIPEPVSHYVGLLKLHIGLAFFGVTAFAFAGAISALYLIQARALRHNPSSTLQRRLPPLVTVDKLAFRSILWGFPFYTLALLIGSVFAMSAEAQTISLSYWSALFSWLVYGFIIYVRVSLGWRGRRAAILTLSGLFGIIVVLVQYSMRGA
jgi:ABC-type transport system involved in cytochrome c biogenesis permease subunit